MVVRRLLVACTTTRLLSSLQARRPIASRIDKICQRQAWRVVVCFIHVIKSSNESNISELHSAETGTHQADDVVFQCGHVALRFAKTVVVHVVETEALRWVQPSCG